MSRHYTLLVIRKTVYASLWKIAPERQFSLGILSSMEVNCNGEGSSDRIVKLIWVPLLRLRQIFWRNSWGNAHGFEQDSSRSSWWHQSLCKSTPFLSGNHFCWFHKPGHEYTKAHVKFGISVLQSEPVKKLQAFAEKNKETQGKFTIGDEKVSTLDFSSAGFEGFG